MVQGSILFRTPCTPFPIVEHLTVMEALKQSATGARSDLAGLIRQHQRMVWRYLRMLGADAADAEDLLQETFLRLAAYLEDRGEVRVPVAFLRSVARNQFLAQRRVKKRRESTIGWTEAVDAMIARDPDAFEDERIDALRLCQSKLCGRAAEAVELHYIQSLSYEETARRLGLKLDGLRALLHRTRRVLRECVQRFASRHGDALS